MMKEIPIKKISRDHGIQARVRLDDEAVKRYAEVLQEGGQLPCPDVTFDAEAKVYFVCDGWHRIEAHVAHGAEIIMAAVHEPKKDMTARQQALLFAVGSNVTHGVPRSNADKRRAVELALAEWPDWSDRRLADACSVGNKFVGDVRKQLCSEHSSTPRKGADGKVRKLPEKAPPAPEGSEDWAIIEDGLPDHEIAVRVQASDGEMFIGALVPIPDDEIDGTDHVRFECDNGCTLYLDDVRCWRHLTQAETDAREDGGESDISTHAQTREAAEGSGSAGEGIGAKVEPGSKPGGVIPAASTFGWNEHGVATNPNKETVPMPTTCGVEMIFTTARAPSDRKWRVGYNLRKKYGSSGGASGPVALQSPAHDHMIDARLWFYNFAREWLAYDLKGPHKVKAKNALQWLDNWIGRDAADNEGDPGDVNTPIEGGGEDARDPGSDARPRKTDLKEQIMRLGERLMERDKRIKEMERDAKQWAKWPGQKLKLQERMKDLKERNDALQAQLKEAHKTADTLRKRIDALERGALAVSADAGNW